MIRKNCIEASHVYQWNRLETAEPSRARKRTEWEGDRILLTQHYLVQPLPTYADSRHSFYLKTKAPIRMTICPTDSLPSG